jgi:hypothetical protein
MDITIQEKNLKFFEQAKMEYINIKESSNLLSIRCVKMNYNNITKMSIQEKENEIQYINRYSNKAISSTIMYDNWKQE